MEKEDFEQFRESLRRGTSVINVLGFLMDDLKDESFRDLLSWDFGSNLYPGVKLVRGIKGKGHEVLKKVGGSNPLRHNGELEDNFYYLDKKGNVNWIAVSIFDRYCQLDNFTDYTVD